MTDDTFRKAWERSKTPCPRCKGEHESGDGVWPGSDGFDICQMCWEAECSASWWKMGEKLEALADAED